MKIKKCILLIIIALIPLLEAKPPEVAPKDVQKKVKEIFKAHVTYKKMTNELMARVLKNYIQEIDATKTYLMKSEIAQWLEPSDELLDKMISDFKNNNYSSFEEIHTLMNKAITRRNHIESTLEKSAIIKDIKAEDLKEDVWPNDLDELSNKLLKVRSLQQQAAEKFNEETIDTFFQRINKRRLSHEAELIGSSDEEQKKIILSYFLKAFATALDTHTNYFTPSEASQFMIHVQQRLFGIGAQLRDSLNGFSIVRILDNGPASKGNKLKINDKIVAVDNEPVVGMDITEAVELIRGEKGTKVLLTILRETQDQTSEKINVELTRGEVVLEESRLESSLEPFADGVIAHLSLFSFYQDPKSSSASDIKKTIQDIQKNHNLKGIVLDLRNNSGGLLPQAVSVTGLFITKGIVVSIKDNSGKVQHLRDTDGKMSWDGPLVVLVNRASASAAEIVAQTLKDYGRAIVVGDEHTFGKGTFQTFTLDAAHDGRVNPQGEYKVTRGMYYTVSGKSPQLVGVKSDIEVPGLLSQLDIGEEFAKYPLQNDEIEPHFEDDLSDIPILHRHQIGKLYKHNLQEKLDIYTRYVDKLKQNSKIRIDGNKTFQNFLKEAKEKKFDSSAIEAFGQSDLQLQETFSIIKDLIFLMQLNEKPFT
jgi:carboxyl-terminal processing protease